MKKAIEKLEQVKSFLDGRYRFGLDEGVDNKPLKERIGLLAEAIAELKAPPRWETPEQWKKRMGEPWPDDWPVWCISDEEEPEWRGHSYRKAKKIDRVNDTLIICANFDGPLPPDGWRPEEGESRRAADTGALLWKIKYFLMVSKLTPVYGATI
jgi:hypothetical protein